MNAQTVERLKRAIPLYALAHDLSGGAYGHTPIPALAYLGEEFLASKHGEDLSTDDFVTYVFSTYARHDEDAINDYREGKGKERLFQGIRTYIIKMLKTEASDLSNKANNL